MATTTMKVGDPAACRRHRAPRHRVAVRALGVALTALLLVSGCGAGRNAETSHEVPAIPGVDADAGPIALRDLLIPFREGGYSAGSDVPLVVPRGHLLLVPGSGPYLGAEHITAALPYAASIPVRFSVSTGDSVQVDVPIAPPTYPVTSAVTGALGHLR